MSLRKPSNAPMTKGLALIHAREILGPSTTVGRTGPVFRVIAPGVAIYGSDWEQVLDQAQKDPQAAAWQNYKDGRKLAFKDAVKSLKDKAVALLRGKEAKLLTKSEHHFVRNILRGLA